MEIANTFAELIKAMERHVELALKNYVYPAIQKEMHTSIETVVYDSYVPTTYVRRNAAGGLADKQSIVLYMPERNAVEVRNIARPNKSLSHPPTRYTPSHDTQFAAWIERGQVRNIFGAKDGPWLHPRPFTQHTMLTLKSNGAHIAALRKGLKIQCLKIE